MDKHALRSRTVQGALVALIGGAIAIVGPLCLIFGWDPPSAEFLGTLEDRLVELVGTAVVFIGAVRAVYGRGKARGPIRWRTKP